MVKFVVAKLFLFFILKNLYLYISFNVVNLLYTITCKQINKKKIYKYFRHYKINIGICIKFFDININQSIKLSKSILLKILYIIKNNIWLFIKNIGID